MNEPTSFSDGGIYGCTRPGERGHELDRPPYVPAVGGGDLSWMTACPSARQHIGSHYDLHNLYAHYEMNATHQYARIYIQYVHVHVLFRVIHILHSV